MGFLSIAVLGFLLKFNTQFVVNLLEKAFSKWDPERMEMLARNVMIYGSEFDYHSGICCTI